MENEITERQARALLNVPQDRQMTAYRRIKDLNLDSAGTEEFVRSMAEVKPPKRKKHLKGFLKDARIAVNTIRAAEKDIRGANVRITDDLTETEDE